MRPKFDRLKQFLLVSKYFSDYLKTFCSEITNSPSYRQAVSTTLKVEMHLLSQRLPCVFFDTTKQACSSNVKLFDTNRENFTFQHEQNDKSKSVDIMLVMIQAFLF